MTAPALAREAGLQRTQVPNFLAQEHRRTLDPDTLLAIAYVARVSILWLEHGMGEPGDPHVPAELPEAHLARVRAAMSREDAISELTAEWACQRDEVEKLADLVDAKSQPTERAEWKTLIAALRGAVKKLETRQAAKAADIADSDRFQPEPDSSKRVVIPDRPKSGRHPKK